MAFDKKVSDLGDEINRLERSVRALRAELKTANANSHSANTAYQRASTEVDALRAQLDALQPADTTKIDVYEAAIAVINTWFDVNHLGIPRRKDHSPETICRVGFSTNGACKRARSN